MFIICIMAKKTYKYNDGGRVWTIVLHYARYQHGNGLALLLYDIDEDGLEEPFATVTVNLPDVLPASDGCAFVDENNLPGIGKWLEDNGIAKATNRIEPCGFCLYPEYEFALEGVKFD